MAGSIALSLTQRYDKSSHLPLDGGQLSFYAAGTTTPQNAYQDISLTIPWPNPITLDSGGNVPQLFFADGYVKFRLSNANGVTQIEADFVLVMGPTSGGGAAPSVDATTIMSTGDVKAKYGTGALAGFVRANGRTIGSSTSSASERANPDCQTLFEYLWGADTNLVVSSGRGASANADWVANKNIALPDCRGRALAGLDDMGNSAAGRLTATYFGTAATVLGAAGGSESNAVILTHNHGVNDPQHAHTKTIAGGVSPNVAFDRLIIGVNPAGNLAFSTDAAATGITIQNAGSASGHNIASPAMLITLYVKL